MPNVIDFFELETFCYQLRVMLGIRRRTRRVPAVLATFARVMDTFAAAR
jgi:hypothetical protein